MKNKYFIITVDTEGDNLWKYKKGDEVSTRNSLFIPRFQELCERYEFKPVYLTNYEMVMSDDFVNYIKPKVDQNLCEIGIHIHAWNNPPYYLLKEIYNGNPYLIEYPIDVMRKKFKETYNLIVNRIGVHPISHRAGRWVMDNRYFHILDEFGIKVDCSITPKVSWGHTCGATIMGCDYTNASKDLSIINDIMEVPMTIEKIRLTNKGSFKHKIRVLLKGQLSWLRPATSSLFEMKEIVNRCRDRSFLEFMLHSSELMPGGSPYFINETSIERLYEDLDVFFKYVKDKCYVGATLQDYYNIINKY